MDVNEHALHLYIIIQTHKENWFFQKMKIRRDITSCWATLYNGRLFWNMGHNSCCWIIIIIINNFFLKYIEFIFLWSGWSGWSGRCLYTRHCVLGTSCPARPVSSPASVINHHRHQQQQKGPRGGKTFRTKFLTDRPTRHSGQMCVSILLSIVYIY